MINRELVRKAKEKFTCYADIEYFFENISSADWIQPLWEKGFFKEPVAQKREGDYIQFPFWCESKYLVRMIKKKQDYKIQKLIVDIAIAIKDTKNVRVHEDLADIAFSVIPSLSKKLVPKLLKCLESPYQLLLPHKLSPLIKKFTEAGEEEVAFNLAEHSLRIIPDSKVEGKGVDRQKLIDRYGYNEILKKVVIPLSELNPEKSFCLFFSLLKTALDSKYGRNRPYSDYSYIWRPAVEESKYNRYEHGIKFHLVDAVRTSAEIWAGKDNSKVPEIIRQLENGNWAILDRIALYILKIFPTVNLDATKGKISDISLYDDLNSQYEYFCLANQQAGLLAEEERQEIYKKVLAGPDTDAWKERAKANEQPIPPEAELEKEKKIWVRNRLSIFKKYLDPSTSKTYKSLISEVGELPEDVALPVHYEGVWGGPTSPKTVQELQELSIEELIKFLAEWRPSKDWKSPTPEGLGRTLTEVIKGDSNKYVGKFHLFQGLDPTYVRSIIYGYQEADFEGSEELWTGLLELISWAISQPIEIQGRKKADFDRDSSWDSCRQGIANLLKKRFNVGKSVIPFGMREKAFKVLAPLTKDLRPSISDEKDYHRRPFDLAINTTRGVAMEALVAYALWVKRNLLAMNGSIKPSDISFKDIPEAKEILEYHLDIKKDPVLAIRSVYGATFYNLRYLDSGWIKEKKDLIFPVGNKKELKYFDAAWTPYILFSRFDVSFYSLLNDQYRFFSEYILSHDNSALNEIEALEERYAGHLMIFYLNGSLLLDDVLLTGFLGKTKSSVRAHIMWEVGNWVNGVKEMASDLRARYVNYWNSRLEKAKTTDNLSFFEDELNNFGWWVKSKHLRPEWILDQIHEVVSLIGKIDPDYQVVEFMEEHAQVNMLKSLECIELIFKGEKEGWSAYTWKDPSQRILKQALNSDNESVKSKVESLQNFLIAKGYKNFRNI